MVALAVASTKHLVLEGPLLTTAAIVGPVAIDVAIVTRAQNEPVVARIGKVLVDVEKAPNP